MQTFRGRRDIFGPLRWLTDNNAGSNFFVLPRRSQIRVFPPRNAYWLKPFLQLSLHFKTTVQKFTTFLPDLMRPRLAVRPLQIAYLFWAFVQGIQELNVWGLYKFVVLWNQEHARDQIHPLFLDVGFEVNVHEVEGSFGNYFLFYFIQNWSEEEVGQTRLRVDLTCNFYVSIHYLYVAVLTIMDGDSDAI